MKLIVTADLHYNVARSVEPARRLAEEVCTLDADALLILGDVGGQDVSIVRECLELFDRFQGRKLFVAGNHDLWTEPGGNSLDRLERELPELCRAVGFHPLDIEPTIVDGIGLAGSIGWYDYSFRPVELGIPLRFYEAKIAPGAAARMAEHEHLVEGHSDVPEEALRMGTRWMDGQHVRLPISDVEFCQRLVDRLAEHVKQIAAEVDQIVVGMHHLPCKQLVPEPRNAAWAFASAFLGSTAFGDVLLAEPKVRYVLCGHAHRPAKVTCGHIQCIDVGCTYVAKQYEMLEF